MKKFSNVIFLALLSLNLLAQDNVVKTQDLSEKTKINSSQSMNNVIKITPIVFLQGELVRISYERKIGSHFSVGLGVAPIVFPPLLASLAYPPTSFKGGFALDPEIRWYAASDKAMDGFYLGLYNSSRFSSWDALSTAQGLSNGGTDQYKVNRTLLKYGFELGLEKMMGKHFLVDVYGGLGLIGDNIIATNQRTNAVDNLPTGGIDFRFNISFGYRF